MKTHVLALALVSAAAAPAFAAETLSLEVKTPARGGVVMVALYADGAAFDRLKGPLRTARAAPGARLTFEGLKPGRYAVMAFQDVNGDGRLNVWPIGLPKEPYGFSNGARGTFGPARWKDAAFDLKPGGGVEALSLK